MMTPRRRLCFSIVIAVLLADTALPQDEQALLPADLSLLDLPFGNYSMLRSAGPITQILISKDHSTLVLYTDRKNYKDSHIAGASYRRVDAVKGVPPELDPGAFKGMAEDLLVFGNSKEGSTEPFPGLAYLSEAVAGAGGGSVTKKGSLMRASVPWGIDEARLFIDAPRRRCVIKVCGTKTGTKVIFCRVPVRIEETHDTHLAALIGHFYYTLYRLKKKG